MEKNPLRTLAEIAAIIACIIAVLTFFNIQPSCSSNKDVNNTEVIDEETKIESNIEITPEQTPSHENEIAEKNSTPNEDITPEEEYQSEHKTWAELTGRERVVLPFIKHRKMNYFKHDWDEGGWAFIVVCAFYGGLLLASGVCFIAVALGADDIDGTDSTFSKVLVGFIGIVILTYVILTILVGIGCY